MAKKGLGNIPDPIVSPVQRQLFPPLGSSIDRVPLSLLITVTTVEGGSLPYGSFNEGLVIELIQYCSKVVPSNVEVINDRDALVELPGNLLSHEVAQAIHGQQIFNEIQMWIHCILATRESCLDIQKEREEIRQQKVKIKEMKEDVEREKETMKLEEDQSRMQLETDSSRMQAEFAECRMQMMELSKQVNEQLFLLEMVRTNAEQQIRLGGSQRLNSQRVSNNQINKPPHFPPFSGMEPTPKDECGIETLLFQVKGAREDVTDQAVRSALISCLRGGASSFLEYVGLNAPLDTMVEELTE